MAKDPSKTEKATPKRRNKVRKEGNVPKSQELSKATTLFGGAIALYVYFSVIADRIRDQFQYYFGHAVEMELNQANAYAVIVNTIKELAIIVLPILLIIGVMAFVVTRIQVGKLWTTKVFKFKWKNFNIFNGIKRMFFSPQTFVRLGKSVAFAVVIGLIPFNIIRQEYENFIPMYYADPGNIASYMLHTGFKMVLYTLIPILAIAIFDVWYTRKQYEDNMKMSKQEVKDERKQAEGDPIIKNKQRQKMFAVMAQRMMKEVPKADVVIANPTHFAVALRYDPTVCPAPMVVAKGVDKVAEKIKKIARESRVPIRENRPLARSLYKLVEVGQPIPEDMYKAVAAILAEIWKANGKMPVQPKAA